jgi:TIGR03009 family protein
MRTALLTICGLLLLALGLPPQQPATQAPAAAPLDPEHNPLDNVLLHWQERMQSIDTLQAQVEEVKEDKVFGRKDAWDGQAKYMRPNLASLYLRRRDNPNTFRKYICTGTFFYEYNQSKQEIRVNDVPPPKPGQVADDNFLSFMFGMKAAEAKRRYALKLLPQDQNLYYMIEILPRFQEDREDFQKAYLALTQDRFIPRAVRYVEPNGNTVTWNIPTMDIGARLDRNEFTQPQLPAGWKFFKVPPREAAPAGTPQPRLYRPNQ